MAMLSFVLVAHGEQAFLRDCVASVLDQAPADVEVVAIDDASPDHGPAVLDELALGDGRVRVEHLRERLGPAAARNLALDLVAGDHVWFVEATDVLEPRALHAVLERLRADSPDVLVVHHSRRRPLGPARPGPHAGALAAAAGRGTGRLEEHPALADAAPRAWDKVLRTGLVGELGLRFAAGGHGELPVTLPALLAAERIAALAQSSYLRREPDNAQRRREAGGSALDVFGHCEAVLAFVDAHRELPAARRALAAPAMLRLQLELLGRVPDRRRHEYVERMAGFLRGHPADPSAAGGRLAQARARLAARDGRRALDLLDESLRARRALRRGGVAVARRRDAAAGRARRAALE